MLLAMQRNISDTENEIVVEKNNDHIIANSPHNLWTLTQEQIRKVFEITNTPIPFDVKQGKFFILMVRENKNG